MVRIFCLTSITKIPEQLNDVENQPYDDVIERLWCNEKEKIISALRCLKRDEPSYGLSRHIFSKNLYPREYNIQRGPSNFSDFKLTELCIGWKSFKGRKMFCMYIFREDTDIIKIKMVRGAVKFIEIKISRLKDAFDLVISTSKQYDNYVENIDFDIYLKVRCIKNTKERYITQTEEELYKSYAQKLNNIDKDLREAELIKNPLILPNKSEANVLRTKLSDISILIRLLCDPHTGSVENALPKRGNPTPRYCQQLSIWLKCVNEIAFEGINIFDVSLEDLLYEINLSNLRILKLRKCSITKLSRKFLKMLPETLEEIDFSYNNLSLVTQPISKLCRLKKLDLFQNKDLTDIPWTDLPQSLEELDLQKTNVLIIPKEICLLTKLKYLSGNFTFVSWSSLSKTMKTIYICDSKVPLNEILLNDKCNLTELTVKNAGLTDIDCKKLPPGIRGLDLSGNNIKNFDCENSLPDLRRLTLQAETINWETLSPKISALTLFNIANIPRDISKFTNLKNLKINSKFLKEIDCSKLPWKIKNLKLENNKLKNFDTQNALLKLEMLNLTNNEMETLSWENLSASLFHLKIDNNQLNTIGNISNLQKLSRISAANNCISNLCFAKEDNWSIFSKFRRLSDIDLGFNNLAHLPIGFEKLECLRKLSLNNNKFDYKNGNIDQKLWNQLPINLQHLNLNFNSLHEIPCSLKRLTKLKIFEVVDCRVSKICSCILSTIVNRRPMPFHEIYMDIRKNPNLKNLPYIPRNISTQFTNSSQIDAGNKTYNLVIDNLDLINISTHKIKYDFKESEEEVSSICKCCTKCGVETNEKAIKQLFAMDLTMILELENGKEKEYPKGKWRSNVNVRLCTACLTSLKDIILSDEFKTLQTKTVAVLPGKRENSISTNVLTLTNIGTPEKRSFNVLSNIPFYPLQLNQFYNTASYETTYTKSNEIVLHSNIELADGYERLPSINQIYSNNRYNTNLQQQSRTFEIEDCNLSNMNWGFNSCISTIPGANNELTAADKNTESNYFVQAPPVNLLYDSNDNNFDPSYL